MSIIFKNIDQLDNIWMIDLLESFYFGFEDNFDTCLATIEFFGDVEFAVIDVFPFDFPDNSTLTCAEGLVTDMLIFGLIIFMKIRDLFCTGPINSSLSNI